MIEPPFYRLYRETYSLTRYPLSIGYLVGAIRRSTNWKVMAYNADFHQPEDLMKTRFMTGVGYGNYLRNLKDMDYSIWKEVQSVISEFRPSVIGISSKSQNFASAIVVAKIAKRIDRGIIVIVGGPHATLMGGRILENPDIDLCVRGEGEETIVELLRAIESNEINDAIAGISFRKNGLIVNNPPRGFIENLDDLCFPHQFAAEVFRDYDQYPKDAFSSIFATRGCPHNCTFCGSRYIWSRRVRFRSPENIVKEINALRELGITRVTFEDDTFGVNKKFLTDLCTAIKDECHGIRWKYEIHVNLVNEENISLMKEAGCDIISLGVESGNNQILKEIRKNITIKQAEAAAELIKKHGIKSKVFFMVGFPQETRESLNDTMMAIKRIKADTIVYSIFTPYPGTEIFDLCKEKELVKDDFDVSLYNHQSPANCFCTNISPEEFRTIVGEIERVVDRRKLRFGIEEMLTKQGLERLLDLGLLGSMRYLFHTVQSK